MKRVIFLSLVIILVIGSCTQEKSPIEGAWKCIYGKSGSSALEFPNQIKGEQIKVWTKEHFILVGQVKWPTDTVFRYNYASGTYVLNGNRYEENVKIHASKGTMGRTVNMIMEVRNDTLIQSWSVDENWNLRERHSIEKYVRLE